MCNEKECPKCGQLHKKPGIFCSRSCANSRTFSEETLVKKSESAKKSLKVKEANLKQTITKIQKTCEFCKKSFEVRPCKASQKTCSKSCSMKNLQLTNTNLSGGYREGSGRSHSGYYKGIYCGSTYELVWVMYNLKHEVPFTRFSGFILYGDNKKYYPDFIIEDTIYEIKGFFISTVKDKCEAAIKQGYKIKVLYKEDLKHMFDWFYSTYPSKKLKDMYEEVS